MRSVVIGGGVGGCAVAAALRGLELGREVEVLERRPAGAPAGMGFILMPNGLAALDEIAPEIDWRGAGAVVDRVSLRLAGGSVLSDHAIDPAVCVGRERFLGALRGAIGGARIHDARALSALEFDRDGNCAAARLEDGGVLEGDAFFGCDGARSRTRALLFPDAELAEVVVKEIVSVAHSAPLAARLGRTFQKYHDEEGGFAVGMLAESAERVVWFVQFDSRRWPSVGGDAEGMRAFVSERVAGWSVEVALALAATDFRASHLWPTRDLPPLASLAVQNIALVGDAAHACLPFTSQGANGALVDAAILRRLLAEVRDHAGLRSALTQYSEARRPHHRRMFMEGRRLREAFLAPLASSRPAVPLVA